MEGEKLKGAFVVLNGGGEVPCKDYRIVDIGELNKNHDEGADWNRIVYERAAEKRNKRNAK